MSAPMESPATHLPHPSARRLVPILAGGGTRLPAHVGVLRALDELGVISTHLVGVSGGSIVAGLRAAGWSTEAMKTLATEVDFRQFRGLDLWQLLFRGGLSSGDGFEHWMDRQLNGARFEDLALDLHVVATDVLSGEPVIFDRARTAEMRVAQAIRYSMGIPLLFAYKEHAGRVLIDGSILAEEALRQDWAGDGTPLCSFRLRASPSGAPARHPLGLSDYLQALIRTFMTSLSHEFVQDAFWNATIIIDTNGISPLEFGLSPATKLELYRLGYETTRAILPIKMARHAA